MAFDPASAHSAPAFELHCKQCRDVNTVTPDQLAQITGIEADYIHWAVASDGAFENGRWIVTL